jgi:hypothetical protein
VASGHGQHLTTLFNILLYVQKRLRGLLLLLESALNFFSFLFFQILDEYSDHIHDLSRKFFHHLLRHNQMAKSFQLAVDVNDYDLFMDLYHSALTLGFIDLADASLVKVILADYSDKKNPLFDATIAKIGLILTEIYSRHATIHLSAPIHQSVNIQTYYLVTIYF